MVSFNLQFDSRSDEKLRFEERLPLSDNAFRFATKPLVDLLATKTGASEAATSIRKSILEPFKILLGESVQCRSGQTTNVHTFSLPIPPPHVTVSQQASAKRKAPCNGPYPKRKCTLPGDKET
jgi:hypothetical protein